MVKPCDSCKKDVTEWWYIVMNHFPTGAGLYLYICTECKKAMINGINNIDSKSEKGKRN